jgi:hypothetical protein
LESARSLSKSMMHSSWVAKMEKVMKLNHATFA